MNKKKLKISSKLKYSIAKGFNTINANTDEIIEEINSECCHLIEFYECYQYLKSNWKSFVFFPYLPSIFSPGSGWLLKYILGPYDQAFFSSILYDVIAGITLSLIFIPQALSYAQIANIPSINSMYSGILPTLAYLFFGTSNYLHIGVTSGITLVLVEVIGKYNIDYEHNVSDMIDFLGEASFAIGLLLLVGSFFNMGFLISFISFPVLGGYTISAALSSALSQLKNAVGFAMKVPQTGQKGYPYNYQIIGWYIENWNKKNENNNNQSYINPYAVNVFISCLIPLVFFSQLNKFLKSNRKIVKTRAYRVFELFYTFLPIILIIITTRIVYNIKLSLNDSVDTTSSDYYYKNTLKILGKLDGNLNYIQFPKFKYDFLQLLIDCFPISIIVLMESYSVSYKLASENLQIKFLNPSQELFSLGMANLFASISATCPTSGSFSRACLNENSGAKSLLSVGISIIGVVIIVSSLTELLEFIPSAALAAIIWASTINALTIKEFWDMWKHSKKDLLIFFITILISFLFTQPIGLACGVGTSLLVLMCDIAFSNENKPDYVNYKNLYNENDVEKKMNQNICQYQFNNDDNNSTKNIISNMMTSYSTDDIELTQEDINSTSEEIIHLLLKQDLNFLSSARFIHEITSITINDDPIDDINEINNNRSNRSKELFEYITNYFNSNAKNNAKDYNEVFPPKKKKKIIIIDFKHVCIIDISAMRAIKEASQSIRKKNNLFLIINCTKKINLQLRKFKIYNDKLFGILPFDLAVKFHYLAGNIIPFVEDNEDDIDECESEIENKLEVNDDLHELDNLMSNKNIYDLDLYVDIEEGKSTENLNDEMELLNKINKHEIELVSYNSNNINDNNNENKNNNEDNNNRECEVIYEFEKEKFIDEDKNSHNILLNNSNLRARSNKNSTSYHSISSLCSISSSSSIISSPSLSSMSSIGSEKSNSSKSN